MLLRQDWLVSADSDSEQGFREWYNQRLKPWVHYVPVKADLSDFDQKVCFVRTNDDADRAIGHEGRHLARSMDFTAEMSAAADWLISWPRNAHVVDCGRRRS